MRYTTRKSPSKERRSRRSVIVPKIPYHVHSHEPYDEPLRIRSPPLLSPISIATPGVEVLRCLVMRRCAAASSDLVVHMLCIVLTGASLIVKPLIAMIP